MSTVVSNGPRAMLRYWGGIFTSAGRNWLESQAFIYAAALAFFTVFSIAPVMIIAVTVVGLVLGDEAAEGQIMAQLQNAIGPEAAEVVETAVINSQIEQSGLLPTIVGIAAILIGASTVFAQMQQSLNRIWDVAAQPTRNSILLFIRSRMLSLILLFGAAFTRAHLEARGLPVRPRSTAVGVHRELIEDPPDASA